MLARTRFFQPLFAYLIEVLEVKYSGKNRLPFSTRDIANKIATTNSAEPMKQRPPGFDFQVTTLERKPGVS
jgi:hypothetical protein